MVATRETLRSWFYRPWFLATIAAVLSASLLIAGGMFFAMRQVEQSESREMNAQGERFLARLEQLFGQLRESLDDLEAQPLRSCDGDMIATLQQVTFNYRFVYEAAYSDGTRTCSNRPRQEGLTVARQPDIKGPTYSYWLNTTTEPDENRAALMLGRGNFRVATSRGHLTDMVDLSPGSSLLVVLDHGSRAIPVLGTAQTWPPAEPWPPIPQPAVHCFGAATPAHRRPNRERAGRVHNPPRPAGQRLAASARVARGCAEDRRPVH